MQDKLPAQYGLFPALVLDLQNGFTLEASFHPKIVTSPLDIQN